VHFIGELFDVHGGINFQLRVKWILIQ
jgi:hypothetical protein